MGDLNMDKTNWNSQTSEDPYQSAILELIDSYNLAQAVQFNTTNSSLLDIVLTTAPDQIENIQIDQDFESSTVKSNHRPISLTISFDVDLPKRINIKTYSFCRCNFISLKSDIINDPFLPKCYSNIDKMLDEWYDWVNKKLEKHCPKRTQHRYSLPPWVSQESSNLMKKLNTAEKLLEKDHCNEATKRKFDLIKTKLNGNLSEDKTCYENKIFLNRDTKELFGYLKILGKEITASEIHWKSKKARTSVDKANLFNQYFSSIWPSLSTETNVHIPSGGSVRLHFDKEDIHKHLSALKLRKSKGSDSLPPQFYKNSLPDIIPSLLNLYKNIVRTKTFPRIWKHANVIPVFKKDSKTDVQNYRPISLLNIGSKVLEKIMYDTIFRCFNEFCSDRQYGFRPGRSPVLRILQTLSKIYDSWSNENIALILFDFQKAFDSIDHEILLKKLAQIGLHQSFFDLLRSYLTGRTQSVTFEDITSESVNVRGGVPQG